MRVMMLYPGAKIPGFDSYTIGGSNEAAYMSHGLAMLSEILKRAGHEVFLNDLRTYTGWEDFEATVRGQDFDIVLCGFLSVDAEYAEKALGIIKKHFINIPTVVGGSHVSAARLSKFPNADFVFPGEGEWVAENIRCIKSAYDHGEFISYNGAFSELDSLPFVDRSLFNPEVEMNTPLLPMLPTPFHTFLFSRGCPYKCSFCYPTQELFFGKKMRARSVDNCMEEIELLQKTAGLGSIMIHDPLFPISAKWLEEFIEKFGSIFPRTPFWCQMRPDFICKHRKLIRELAEIGLTWVSIGVESGSPRMLKFLNKGVTLDQNIDACNILRANNVNIFCNYILGVPGETKDDIDLTMRMLDRIRPQFHSQSIYTAYPGSALYDYCIENDLFTSEHYGTTRYPYERKVKGVNYPLLFTSKLFEAAKFSSPLREWDPKAHEQVRVNLKVKEKQSTPASKVTVIMTSYNRPKYLQRAIRSILNQTMKDWQMIIVDDASPDEAVHRVLDKAETDQRITTIRNERNLNNVAVHWNRAIDLAQGEYVFLIDDDNEKCPNFAEVMVAALEGNDYLAAACFSEIIGSKSESARDPHIAKTGEHTDAENATKENILERNYIDSGELMFRRSTFDKVGFFDERCITNEDWDMVIRIMYAGKIKIVPEFLTKLRWHEGKRTFDSDRLGMAQHVELIRKKRIEGRNMLVVHYEEPLENSLTNSQLQVCDGIKNALKAIDFVRLDEEEPDIIIVPAPFHRENQDLKELSERAPLMAIHMEDPAALLTNSKKAEYCEFIVANDLSVVNTYREVRKNTRPEDPNAGGKVFFMPALSVNEKAFKGLKEPKRRDYDFIFCGYAYDSRMIFMEEFLSIINQARKQTRMLFIGDRWDDKYNGVGKRMPITAWLPTIDERETMKYYLQSKIIICLHRKLNDLNDPPILARSVHRGYVEAWSGALVMIDDSREEHSFDEDEVVFYSSPRDLARKVNYYLKNPEARQKKAEKAQTRARRDFTFEARFRRLLNCVRSQRFNVGVP